MTVTQVLLSKGDGGNRYRASGVEFVKTLEGKTGNRRVLEVRREVILSAGPYGSGQLLQVSGIGPRETLQKVGVKVKVGLPVGERTQGRVYVPLVSIYSGRGLEPANNSSLIGSVEERRRWESGGGGVVGTSVFAVNGVLEKAGYFIGSMVGFAQGLVDQRIVASFCVGNAKSFGWMRVSGGSVWDGMNVWLNLLSKRREVVEVVQCLKEMRRIHGAFGKDFGMKEVMPADGKVNEAYVRQNAQFAFHFVGGSAVGRVVDGRLKVKGVKGLRVVDSSVIRRMPTSAGPMATTYMIAEYVAEKLGRCYKEHGEHREKAVTADCRGWV